MGSDQSDRHTWLAVGEKVGFQAITWGAEYTAGELVNIRHLHWKYKFEISSLRLGPGIGAGAGYVLVFIFNCVSPNQLHNTKITDWGFNFSTAGKLDKFAGALANLKLSLAVGKLAYATAFGIKNADSIRNAAHTICTTLDIANSNQPSVICLDTPIGLGLEISYVDIFGTFKVTENTSAFKPRTY